MAHTYQIIAQHFAALQKPCKICTMIFIRGGRNVRKLGLFVFLGLFMSLMINPTHAQQNEASFEVGWTKLPVQTKFENFKLQCRPARIVLYSKVNLKEIKLTEELWNVSQGCGKTAVGKIGIVKAITNPSGATDEFISFFKQCAIDTTAEKIDAIGLYTQGESGEWGSCTSIMQ
jgi:hypothetical protein